MKFVALGCVISLLLFEAEVSHAQFSIGSSYVTFTGSTPPISTAKGQFFTNQSYHEKIDNQCLIDQYPDYAPGSTGGFDHRFYDATLLTPSRPEGGVVIYGGLIEQVYTTLFGGCTALPASFGFHTGNAQGSYTGTDVDLSSVTNQKIKFTYRNAVGGEPYTTSDLPVQLQVLDYNSNELITAIPFTFLGDNQVHTETIDFSNALLSGKNLKKVRMIIFNYTSEDRSDDFGISLTNIQLGSSVTTETVENVSQQSSFIAYPNPNNEGLIHFNMEVKYYTLTDAMGTVVSKGETVKSIDASNLAKGIYFLHTEKRIQKIILN